MRVTRGVVIASTVAAGFAEAYLAGAYAPELPVFWMSIAGFLLLLIVGQRYRSVAFPIVMPALYLMPAIFLAIRGGEHFSLDIIWVMPLLGLCLSGRGAWQWSLPSRWQWPLVTWATLVAVVWPIVFLRESDFALWILPLERVSNTSEGMGPWEVALNVAYFALAHNAGILFVDALCRWYANARDRFRHEVLAPMAIAAAIACVVALYQGFVDLTFLNRGFWAYMIRASGTLADPNKLGAVTAFWTLGAVVLARRWPRPWSVVVPSASLVLGVAAVWVSGSRTGLAAVATSLVIALIEAIRHWRATRSASPIDTRRIAAFAVLALVVAAALVAVLQRASTHTIVARGTLGYLPLIGDRGILDSANELLWERFGYGPAAIQMIREHPIDGIGVGTFHALVIDYGKATGYALTSDNAQSWFRHNLAELGLLGSIPMLWWCGVLTVLMFSKSSGSDRLSIGMLRGVLVGFFVASIFGMPAQSIAITITFWVFAFWFLSEAAPAEAFSWKWSRTALIATTVLIVLHAGITIVDANGDLRPRNRSTRFGWFYKYGMTEVEPDPGGNPIGRRWTMKDSLAMIPVQGKMLKFVAWIDHPDSDQNPVHTRIWADSVLIYEGDLKRSPLFLDIPATPGKTHLLLETSIDRVWRPIDAGVSRDRRELGLSIRDWVWE